jgi:hypothetical protein
MTKTPLALLLTSVILVTVLGGACSVPEQVSKLKTLPNAGIMWPEADSSVLYTNVIAAFEQAGFDLRPAASPPSLVWPLDSERKALLTRFGTPTLVVGSLGKEAFKFAYFHEALDIVRARVEEDDKVRAPITGFATVVFDGEKGDVVTPYGTAIAIYDPISHLVTSLLHVSPSEALSAGRFVEVRQGEVIGQLSPVESMVPEIEAAYRHTHLALLNGHDKRLLNPLTRFSQYLDTVSPTIEEIYLTDETGNRIDVVRTGALDVIAKVFDRDDLSGRNFEVASLTFSITDDRGFALHPAINCNLNIFTESSLAPTPAHAIGALLDFGNALGQVTNEGWVDFATDAVNPNRTFRYALSNIVRGPNSCEVVADIEGAVTITDSVRYIDIDLAVSDPNGNVTSMTKRISR